MTSSSTLSTVSGVSGIGGDAFVGVPAPARHQGHHHYPYSGHGRSASRDSQSAQPVPSSAGDADPDSLLQPSSRPATRDSGRGSVDSQARRRSVQSLDAEVESLVREVGGQRRAGTGAVRRARRRRRSSMGSTGMYDDSSSGPDSPVFDEKQQVARGIMDMCLSVSVPASRLCFVCVYVLLICMSVLACACFV
jgi:hypothetical protein